MREREIPIDLLGRAMRGRDAIAAGLSPSRARSLDVDHPDHGVIAIDAPDVTIADRCHRYLPAMLPGQFFSHLTAALLWAMPVPAPLSPLDVAVIAPRTPPRRPGVRGRRIVHADIVEVHGLPVTSPAQTWRLIAPLVPPADLIAAGDALLPAVNRPGIASVEELAHAAALARRSAGAAAAARALPQLRAGVASRPETHLRVLLVEAGLPEPVVAHPVRVANGMVLHPDLSYPQHRLALEYEGQGHLTSARQWRHDIERRERFEEIGWRVVRITSDDVFVHPDRLIARIRRILAGR